MAGHSQFKNIMHRKGAPDAKRAKVFTKLIRELTVAAKQGADPDANPRLRAAVLAAREANMPKDTMERAIQRGSGGVDGENFEEIRYEGYGPGGVALIVEVLTDNRNRTAPELRTTFSKYGGNLGESNSVSFQFEHVGFIEYPEDRVSADDVLALGLDAGVEDIVTEEGIHSVYCAQSDLHKVRETLAKTLGDPLTAKRIWKPKIQVAVDEEAAQTLLKLVQALEDNDDVQNVFFNADIAPDILEKLG